MINRFLTNLFKIRQLAIFTIAALFLTACSTPQVTVEERLFLPLSLNFLDQYVLDQIESSARSLSKLSYELPGYGTTDPGIHFYGLTTAPSKTAPVQFYDLNLELDSNFSLTPAANSPRIKQAKIQNVTPLQNKQGETLPSETTQPESLVFSPRNSIFITTEEQEGDLAFPFIGEFDLGSGQLRNIVPIPPRYYPEIEQGTLVQGVQPESGFQVMTIAPDGFSPGGMDPFRLFVASSTPLIQDIDPNYSPRLRLLHYVIADRASFLVSEMFYPVETDYQLAELIALPESGRFLSLEVNSHGGKIYQVATGDATDTSRVEHLRGNLRQIKPLQKQLLFDLENLDIPTTQLTGMTLGPKLSNGRQSLVLVGQNSEQMAELLWFGVS